MESNLFSTVYKIEKEVEKDIMPDYNKLIMHASLRGIACGILLGMLLCMTFFAG